MSLDTNTSNIDNDNPRNNSTYAGTDPCRHSEGLKFNLLEKRLQMFENQIIFMNNMLIQNQTQATIRDKQLLMNSQYYQPNSMTCTTLPGYSHPVHIYSHMRQILCRASLGRGNESLFAAPGSHDQDGRHTHIW